MPQRPPLRYVSTGEGEAILSVHGGMGGLDQSLLLAKALLGDAADRRVVAVSRPGYPGTALERGASPEQQADLYARLLDDLGIDTAWVTAISAGGPSALQFALRHRQRCRGLVLVSCCTGRLDVPPDVVSRLRVMKFLARVPGLTALMRWRVAKASDETARRSIADPQLRARTLAHPQAGPMLRNLQIDVFRDLSQRLPGTTNDVTLFSTLDRIAFERIDVPALIIHGTGDRVVPFSHAQNAAAAMPQAQLMAIEDGEHVALFTHLDDVRARTARFLASDAT